MFACSRDISHHIVTTLGGKSGVSNGNCHKDMDILASIGRSCNTSVTPGRADQNRFGALGAGLRTECCLMLCCCREAREALLPNGRSISVAGLASHMYFCWDEDSQRDDSIMDAEV
jgi:hypothetical protein